ncbi:hypothetical protein MVES1_001990 [Malassezia vespertilionis]|uniref:uncharacterized protein n=1 Tax=Malassezia vespertilionis TaxID=2020962 RepID=UPI0024B04810|nr:uncharacterized protein MVES1_001990 [Malassezia vespertilionis]WFD06636.1 hypothetical protein MVES1_001990 [Malassezia vespertilionis]
MNVKGMRRVSSLRDGTPAYPHVDVPDDVLYRHITDQVPPVVRMKHLLDWTLHRSLQQALGAEAMPQVSKRAMRKARESGPMLFCSPPSRVQRPLSEQEKQQFAEAAPTLRKVTDHVLHDLNDGLIGISWLSQSSEIRTESLQPHPRNLSNTHAAEQLEGMKEQLAMELKTWKGHEEEIAKLNSESDTLESLASQLREQSTSRRKARASASGFTDDGDEDQAIADEVELAMHGSASDVKNLAWSVADLDEPTTAQLAYANGVLASTCALNDAVTARGQGQRYVDQDDSSLCGTEVDPRLLSLETVVDKLNMSLYSISQLDRVAGDYIMQVSARAAQALQERAAASDAGFVARAESRGAETGIGVEYAAAHRLDTLLASIRDPQPDTRVGSDSDPLIQVDTRTILRALADVHK